MKTLKDRFEEILKDFSGSSFEEAPLYCAEDFLQATKEWLEQKRDFYLIMKKTVGISLKDHWKLDEIEDLLVDLVSDKDSGKEEAKSAPVKIVGLAAALEGAQELAYKAALETEKKLLRREK